MYTCNACNCNTYHSFHDCVISAGSPLTVKQLIIACKSVTNWHTLGIHLDITPGQLHDIRVDCQVCNCKTAMFDTWLKSSPNASWGDLIIALRSMGEHTVASEIEADYSPTTGTVIA